jgi:acyl-CoA hydrolase
VKTELQKEPEDREDVVDFMKYAKMEYEKLVEQSPPIPPEIVNRLKENVDKSEVHVHLPPNAGVFERIDIGKQGIRMVPESLVLNSPKEKSSMERVLQELDKSDNLPRTERKLSRAVSFAPSAYEQEQGNSVLSLSNKLMSSFNQKAEEVVVEIKKEVEDLSASIVDENK